MMLQINNEQPNNNDYDNIQTLLGYVLEKHINRRKTGSYDTPDDTTKYITHYSILISFFYYFNEIYKGISLNFFCISVFFPLRIFFFTSSSIFLIGFHPVL